MPNPPTKLKPNQVKQLNRWHRLLTTTRASRITPEEISEMEDDLFLINEFAEDHIDNPKLVEAIGSAYDRISSINFEQERDPTSRPPNLNKYLREAKNAIKLALKLNRLTS